MTNFLKHKLRKKSPMEIVGAIIFGGILITGLAILFGYVIMWLWNWLMPMIFGLPMLTFWQAVGLFALSKFLLGGIGGSCDKKSSKKKWKCKDKEESKTDFSKWKHYDEFWDEEGEERYQEFLEKKNTIKKEEEC